MYNKVFKFSIFVLVISIILGIQIFHLEQYSIKMVDNFFYSTTEAYSPIKIPQKIRNTNENKKIIDIIQKASNENKIGFLKRVDNQGYYIKEGLNFLFLSKTDITFYISEPAEHKVQIPPIGKSRLAIENIQALITQNEFEGQFFIKTLDRVTYDTFVEMIRNDFNIAFKTNFRLEDFSDFNRTQSYRLGKDMDMYNISSYLHIGIAFLFVISIFWIASFQEKNKILRINGYSIIAIVNTIVGKWYGIALVISPILVFVLLNPTLSYFSLINFIFVYGLLLLLYFWFFLLVYFFTVVSEINDEKIYKVQKKLNMVLPFIIKLVFLLFMVVSGTDLVRIILTAKEISIKHDTPQNISEDNFHIYYPVTVGKNNREFIYDKDYWQVEEDRLYRYLNSKGSILVNLQAYEIDINEIFGRGISVNPNYLEKFEIFDIEGNRVLIDESIKSKVLLIPQYMMDRPEGLEKIKKYYHELAQFNHQDIQIIYIKNQPVYSFNSQEPWIDDYPFLTILTLGNSTGYDRNSFNGAKHPPLKINTSNLSMKEFDNLLEELQVKDNLPHLFPFENAEIVRTKRLTGSLFYILSISIITIFSFSIVCILTTMFSFQFNKRKFELLRLNGYSFFHTYKIVLLGIVAELILVGIISLILAEINRELLLNLFIAMFLNIIIVSITLFRLEKNQEKNFRRFYG